MGLNVTTLKDTIYENSTLELEAKFTDQAGVAVDPTEVTLDIVEPDDVVITKLKSASELLNPAVGTWQFRYRCDKKGRVRYTWLGDSPGSDSSERSLGSIQVLSEAG